MKGERHRRRGCLERVLAVAVGTVFVVVVAEVLLRLAGVCHVVFETYDDDRGVALACGREGWYDKEGRAYIEINSDGYRDVEHEREKQPGVFRIAVLGDSFTEARQVDLEQTFFRIAEGKLNARGESARRVEFLSFGVGGYSTLQELLTLRRDALSFEPDLVLLAFTIGNDISDNSKRLSRDGFRPFSVPRDGELQLDDSFRRMSLPNVRRGVLLWGVQHSKLCELVNQVRRRRWAAVERDSAAQAAGASLGEAEEVGIFSPSYAPPPNPEWEEAWQITEDLLVRLHEESAAAGARFALVTLTNSVHVHPDPEMRARIAASLGVEDLYYPERRLSALGKSTGFPVITLSGPLLEAVQAAPEALWLHGFESTRLGRGHWNADGHRLAGEVLARELLRRGIVP